MKRPNRRLVYILTLAWTQLVYLEAAQAGILQRLAMWWAGRSAQWVALPELRQSGTSPSQTTGVRRQLSDTPSPGVSQQSNKPSQIPAIPRVAGPSEPRVSPTSPSAPKPRLSLEILPRSAPSSRAAGQQSLGQPGGDWQLAPILPETLGDRAQRSLDRARADLERQQAGLREMERRSQQNLDYFRRESERQQMGIGRLGSPSGFGGHPYTPNFRAPTSPSVTPWTPTPSFRSPSVTPRISPPPTPVSPMPMPRF
jgi:hypothetical protein